jgi:hypothetical protein
MRDQILRLYAMTLDEARKLVADVPCERFVDQPFPGAKHPAWVLGHLCIASDMMHHVLVPGGDGTPGAPAEWVDACKPGAAVRGDRGAYATKAELVGTLERLHGRLARAFTSATDGTLASEFPNPEYRAFFPTIADAAVYLMAHHEGYHLGQLTQWRRAYDLPAVGV